jgi:hypothetical protein
VRTQIEKRKKSKAFEEFKGYPDEKEEDLTKLK